MRVRSILTSHRGQSWHEGTALPQQACLSFTQEGEAGKWGVHRTAGIFLTTYGDINRSR